MSKEVESITAELASWIGQQQVFFVATAPASLAGHINCSPKGLDTFRILGPRQVAYLDLTGSGVETIAHLGENGRIVFMFCGFEGPPRIVRLHGAGRVIGAQSPEFETLMEYFGLHPSARSIIVVEVSRVSTSCGYGVPLYRYMGQRETSFKWAAQKGPAGVRQYQQEKNRRSIDGLPGLDVAEPT